MSKSYARYRRDGNGVGSNTSYYRTRRRLYRARWKANMIRAFQNSKTRPCEILDYAPIDPEWDTTIDDVYVHPEKQQKFIDRWREPTDGSWHITSKDVIEYFENDPPLHRRGVYRVKGKNRVKK